MPRSWSEAVKYCRRHPAKVAGKDERKRWCSCKGGSWRYRLGVPDPVTGKISKPKWSPSFPTKEAADDHQLVIRQAIRDKTYTADRGQTLAEYLPAWLAGKEKAGRKTTTTVGYRKIIDTHLVPNLGKHRLGDLRPDHVQALLDSLAAGVPVKGRPTRRPMSAGTLRNVRACLRAALSDAVRKGLVARNVAQLVDLPSVRRSAPVVVEGDRLVTFLTHVEDDPLSALWLLDAVYGMRRAELLGLRWADVDQDSGLIVIRQTLVEIGGHHACPSCEAGHRRLLFDTPKSQAGERAYPLTPGVTAALIAHRLRQQDERALYGTDFADHGLVFAQPDGNPWRPSWISDEFRRLMLASGAAEGLAKVPSLKALRSTMVTNLHEAGTAIEVISKVTGHAGTGVTVDHYLNVSAERTRTAFEVIDARLSAGRSDRLSDQRAGNRSVPSETMIGGGVE